MLIKRILAVGFLTSVLAGCGAPTPQPLDQAGIQTGVNALAGMSWSSTTGGQIAKLENAIQVQSGGTTEITYRLNAQCSELNGSVSLDKSSGKNSNAQFLIFKNDDAKPSYSSLTALDANDAAVNINHLDISNSKELRLRVDASGENVRANWNNLKLNCDTNPNSASYSLSTQADVLTRVNGRIASPDNLRDAAFWQFGPTISGIPSAVAVPTTEDTDGTLDQLKSTAGYQWLRTDMIANPGETLEVSLMLSGTTGSSLQLNIRSTTGTQLAGSGAAYVPVTPTPKRVVLGRFTKSNDGTNVVRLLLAGVTPSDTIYAGGLRVDLVTAGATPPAVPANFVAQSGTSAITLSWLPSVGATGYQLERTATTETTPTQLGSTTNNFFTDGTAIAGTTYVYGLRATNANGSSATINSAAVSLGSVTPPPPTGRMVSPDNLRDPSWSGGPALTPTASTVAVPTSEDTDGTLDLLKSSTGYQWWESKFTALPGETLEVSIMLSGTTGSSLQMNIRGINGGNLAGSGSTYIPVTPTPKRVVVGRFTKANDGTTQVKLLLAGITPSDTIYAGGVRITVIGANPGADTTPPTVSLASNSTNVTAAGGITLTAAANDNVGVSKVEFFEGATSLGVDTTAPYQLPINYALANNGAHNYTAKASDAAGNSTVSTPVTVTVNIPVPDTTPPTVSLAASSTNVTAAGSITLTATATDNVGVTKIEFYQGAVLLGTDTSAPFEQVLNYAAPNNGTIAYTAKAFDAAGNSTTSTALNVNVNITVPDTTAPTVSLAASSPNVTAAGSITLTATATDNIGVTKVEFYEGATLLGTDTTAPFEQVVAYTNANNGAHSYTAKAVDAAGNATTSAPAVNVTVNIPIPDTTPPVVSLAANNTNVTTPGNVVLTATATDNIGVTKVEFYEGATLLGIDTTAPYEQLLSLNETNNGTHTYTAKAFDAAGNTTISAATNVNVNIVAVPNVVLNASRTTVTSTGSVTFTVDTSSVPGVTKVDFVEVISPTINSLLVTDTTAPFENTVSFSAGGNPVRRYRVTAYVGVNTYISNTVQINVNIPYVGLAASNSGVVQTAGPNTLTATPSAGLSVAKVEFFEGATLLGTDTTAPFEQVINYTSANNGTHTYTARVTTTAGDFGDSSPLDVVVGIATGDTTPPTVSLSTVNATVTGSFIDVTINASDNAGLASVELFVDGASLGPIPAPYPYTIHFSYTSSSNGTHTYTAKATDTSGNVTTSAPATATTNIPVPDTVPPTLISFTIDQTNVTADGLILLRATWTDNVAAKNVQFFDGATSLGTVPPPGPGFSGYSQQLSIGLQVAMTAAKNGVHSYTAKVFDNSGNFTISAPIVVTVNIPDIVAPTISLVASSTNVTAAGNLNLTATATDNVAVTQVEFFDGATSLGIDTAAPYQLAVPLAFADNGTHNYTAKATDAAGNTKTSTPAVNVTVNIPDTTPPSLTGFGVDNPNVTAPGNIVLTATATDNVGVTKIEFFDGATSLGFGNPPVAVAARLQPLATIAGTTFTMTVPITSANNGTHSYTAKAYDAANNASAASSPEVVVVNIPTTSGGLLTSNTNNVTTPGPLILTAAATNPADQIVYVVFYDNGVQVGSSEGGWTDTILPTFMHNGTHVYTAEIFFQNQTNSVMTNAVTVNVDLPAGVLASITNLDVQDWGPSDGVGIYFTSPAEATHFQIERRLDGGDYVRLNDLGGPIPNPSTFQWHDFLRFTVAGTHTFQYRFRVYNASGISAWVESLVITRIGN